MARSGQELEIKLWVNNLDPIQRFLNANAVLIQPRIHEINLRFDLPDESLKNTKRVLRLRQDQQVTLTFKGPGVERQGVHVRQELELVVNDFQTARQFLEALGYKVQMIYEKYRSTYQLDEVLITLDEMPYGHFIELEGPEPDQIQKVCNQIGLNWNARIIDSYTDIFDRLKATLDLNIQDLVFANFEGLSNPIASLGLQTAD